MKLKSDARKHPRFFVNTTFPVSFILNLEGTNYRGNVWDLSRKGCSIILDDKYLASKGAFDLAINYETEVLLALVDDLGNYSKITVILKRFESLQLFGVEKHLIACEFLEELTSNFEFYIGAN